VPPITPATKDAAGCRLIDADALRHGTFPRSTSQENPRDEILDVAHPHPARET